MHSVMGTPHSILMPLAAILAAKVVAKKWGEGMGVGLILVGFGVDDGGSGYVSAYHDRVFGFSAAFGYWFVFGVDGVDGVAVTEWIGWGDV